MSEAPEGVSASSATHFTHRLSSRPDSTSSSVSSPAMSNASNSSTSDALVGALFRDSAAP